MSTNVVGLAETSLVAEVAKEARAGYAESYRLLRRLPHLPQDKWERILEWLVDERRKVLGARRSR